MAKFSNEFQIEIDDVYGCPGHCPGCVLSTLEKKSTQPDMDFNLLKLSIEKLIPYVKSLKNIEKLNLTYGIADHFLMSNEYLEKTYHLGADLLEQTEMNNGQNGIFFSASMIGKHNNIMNKVEYLYNISKKRGVPFYIIAVLDPKNLFRKNFSEIYKNNIIKTNYLIGKVDLSINLSEEAIDNISPQEIYDFTIYNQFNELTINWIPTNDNINYVYFNQDKLKNWLIELDKIIEKNGEKISTSYRTVILRTINSIMCNADSNLENCFQDEIKMKLRELIGKSIQISDKGDIFPKYEAIGDIPHSPRLGIEAWGNIKENKSIEEIINQGLKKTEKFILKQFIKNPCLSCNFNKFCSNSGFHIYNHILSKNPLIKDKVNKQINKSNCYHIGKEMFSYYYEKEITKTLD
jgi:hypothetical protein